MHTAATTTLLLAALASIVYSEELKASAVPAACTAICGPMVLLTNTCDINPDGETRRMLRRQTNNGNDADGEEDDESDEVIEAQCICQNKSFNVRSIAALCAACITQNRGETEDMDKIMSQCGFSSTTYTPAATTAVAGINVQATKPAVTLGSTTGTGAAPKSSTTGASAGVRLFDLGAMQCGLVLAGALAVFLGV